MLMGFEPHNLSLTVPTAQTTQILCHTHTRTHTYTHAHIHTHKHTHRYTMYFLSVALTVSKKRVSLIISDIVYIYTVYPWLGCMTTHTYTHLLKFASWSRR